jgi:hypothetical protein
MSSVSIHHTCVNLFIDDAITLSRVIYMYKCLYIYQSWECIIYQDICMPGAEIEYAH